MINKQAEIQDRILLYNAIKGILRTKQAASNPYEAYYNKKIELLSQLAKNAPQYQRDNAVSTAEKNLYRKVIRDMLVGGGVGALGAGATVLTGGGYAGVPVSTLIPTAIGASIKGGIAGLLGGSIYGGGINRKKYIAEGYAEGEKKDKAIYDKAMEQHDKAVKNALDAFNMKYTGSIDPDSASIQRGGVNILNEFNNEQ